MIGPPANPNLTGELISGSVIGIEPIISPKTMPIKIEPKFGSFSVFTVFPNTFSTFFIAAASPTTVKRSPSWSINSGVASNWMPLRKTRLILIP